MDIDYKNMGKWETEKAIYLQSIAVQLGMDVSSYGMVGVNPNSGYTYLWLEDHDFSLYMPINCDLVKSDVRALWTNPENGDEEEMDLEAGTTLQDIENWADECRDHAKEEE
jgi:hypothetical protein